MSKQPERRRRVVRAFAPAVGLLAAGLLVWQGSYAAFNATTVDNGSNWSSATLTLKNDGNGSGAGFANVQNVNWGGATLKPGATGTVCVNVQSSGSSGGAVEFYRTGTLSDTVGPNGAPTDLLSGQIMLTVKAVASATPFTGNCTSAYPAGSTTVINNQALSALPTAWAPATAANSVNVTAAGYAVYQITWTFNSAAGNQFQGASTGSSFQWEMQ